MNPVNRESRIALSVLLSSVVALAFQGGTLRAETVTVPLSDPSRPVVIKTELVNGGITVVAWPGKDVVVEATGRDEDEDGNSGGDGDDESMSASIRDAVHDAVKPVVAQGDRDRKHQEDKQDKGKGMRRIPNAALGLSVEESQNVVRIESESWRRSVDLLIKVPTNATLKLGCVNDGDISVSGVEGDMELSNTNGSITVKGAAGTVVANTVNGEVTVTFTRLPAFKSMAFSSLNGDIDVTLPAALAADVRMSSDNGDMYSDFEIKLTPRPSQVKEERGGAGKFKVTIGKETYGTINGGGAEILFKTFNGDIYIRKGK